MESPFAAVSLRTAGKRYRSRERDSLDLEDAAVPTRTSQRLDTPELLAEVAEGLTFVNGMRMRQRQARLTGHPQCPRLRPGTGGRQLAR